MRKIKVGRSARTGKFMTVGRAKSRTSRRTAIVQTLKIRKKPKR